MSTFDEKVKAATALVSMRKAVGDLHNTAALSGITARQAYVKHASTNNHFAEFRTLLDEVSDPNLRLQLLNEFNSLLDQPVTTEGETLTEKFHKIHGGSL